MLFQIVLTGMSLLSLVKAAPSGIHDSLIVPDAIPRNVPAPNTGVGNNYYYQGCFGYTLQYDPTVHDTKYSYGAPGGKTVSSLQDCAHACHEYYSFIVGDGLFCYCISDRSSLFPASAQNVAPICRNPCPGNKDQFCGGNFGSGEFALFEQA